MIRRVIMLAMLAATVCAQTDDEWATAIGQTTQVTKGLVAYWAMRNSGTTVYDEYTGGYNATATNSVTFGYTYGAVGYGATFDGGDAVLMQSEPFETSAGSISAWVKVTDTTSSRTYFSTGDNADPTYYYFVAFINSSAKPSLQIRRDSTGNQVTFTADGAITANAWTHIVWTQNGTAPVLYVNGASATFATSALGTGGAGDWSAAVGAQTDTAAIGARVRAFTLDIQWLGNIDEVRIYNRAITLAEVKQLYRMGALPRGIK